MNIDMCLYREGTMALVLREELLDKGKSLKE
jgi:hypothetical protein